ncbi:RHS repeat-associated core domain [Serratia quinivorans]|jgi:RHS repeat-associated protein|uniref:RHS repeat-associated core domain-containing protein n=1 Tax=Serratia quinivorans TaxID=137545 RepID=A0ABV3UGF7_9GAMM|nr:RHS repeat-associated core domain-containing protein [Serratia quinivorans]CAI1565160.1 RHS repeat-associated core domain [Serratia quinivorans]CAI1698152.1 RHS repeat-associated core domain [Serratia quinivorans]CAI1722320.1 RHS repeat-associated core domain [Serratia quinivorans]
MKLQFTCTDAMHSVLNQITADGQRRQQSFSPYGGSATVLVNTPGFNGERCDPLTQTTHLGNGYRAYNPILMRFHAPDSMSPFGAGGINCYAYCDGDAINNSDPSGHMSAQAGAGIGLGVLGLALGAVSFGVSIAAKVAVVASVAAIATGVASAVTENSNPGASAALGWVSLGLGIVGTLTGLAPLGGRVMNKLPIGKRYPSPLGGNVLKFHNVNGSLKHGALSFFVDKYDCGYRVNIFGHGNEINGSYYLHVWWNEFMGPGQAWESVQTYVNGLDWLDIEHVKDIRVIMCDGATGGENSFAGQLAKLSGKRVKSFVGSVYPSSSLEEAEIISCDPLSPKYINFGEEYGKLIKPGWMESILYSVDRYQPVTFGR